MIFDRDIHEVHHRGEVTLTVECAPRGEGMSFKVAPGLDSVPPEFINFVEQGAREATLSGPLTGYEVVDITVTLEALGSDLASMTGLGLKVAASQACKEACEKLRLCF